jgi:hypothetical protein
LLDATSRIAPFCDFIPNPRSSPAAPDELEAQPLTAAQLVVGSTLWPLVFVDAYVDVCRLSVEFHKQTWHRVLGPVVEGIAAGDVELTINPHVYLLVYNFDADSRKRIVKKYTKTAQRAAGASSDRQGQPKQFRPQQRYSRL